MRRHIDNHLVRILAAATLAVAAFACVTTRTVEPGASPDPRADLPELSKPALPQAPSKVLVVKDTKPLDPVVNFRIVFQRGSADDPRGKEGLAALSARLMRQATEKLSAAELADTLFPWAAELDVQVDKDTIAFIGRAHQDNANEYADVLLDVILHPRLDANDFARIKAEQKAFIENTLRTGNDELLQREALEVLLYDQAAAVGARGPGAHPYRTTPTGTVAGIESITVDDVRGFVMHTLTRDACVLGISGGARPELVNKLETALNGLPTSTGPRAAPQAPPPPDANVALFIDKPSAGTAISVGFALPELSRAHPDYVAMKVAETWFGEHRNLIGHLFNSMREKRGLNYGDYAYVEHFAQEGWSTYERLNIPRRTQYFSMWIRPVEHKNRHFALRQAVWELDKLVKDGIPDDKSFENVRAFVQGYWRAKEQEPIRKLGYLIDEKLTGQPFDRDDMRARAAKLTRAEVNAAIKRHLRADRLSIVVVTQDAAAFADEVKRGTASPLVYASPTVDPAQAVEDKLIEAYDLHLTSAATGPGAAEAPSQIVVVKPTALFAK